MFFKDFKRLTSADELCRSNGISFNSVHHKCELVTFSKSWSFTRSYEFFNGSNFIGNVHRLNSCEYFVNYYKDYKDGYGQNGGQDMIWQILEIYESLDCLWGPSRSDIREIINDKI